MRNRIRRAVLASITSFVAIINFAGCQPQPISNISDGASTQATAAQPPPGRFSLTVYSAANPATFDPQELMDGQFQGGYYGASPAYMMVPGFGVVRETRPMQIAAGVNQLEFTDVAAGIDPTSVAFESLTAPATTVLEQNFDFDLSSADRLLQKYVGQEVVVTLVSSSWKTPRTPNVEPATIRGTLLSSAGGSYVIRTTDANRQLVLASQQNVESVRLADSNTGLVIKPTLNWKVESKQAGPQQVQVTYQTDGLTWRADYSLLIAPDDKTADLSAWVTLVNGSGISYPDAALKLVAGNVQRFVSPTRAQRIQVTSTLFSGPRGGSDGVTGFEEKSFFEYHLYTLGRTTSLKNNSTKQIELFPPKQNVPVEKLYVYDGLSPEDRAVIYTGRDTPGDDFGHLGNKTVDIYVHLLNSEANHLGIPLPAGRIRSYKLDPADGSREFTGEDIVQHTPKDEPIMARLGTAFELTAERKQTNFARDGNTATESIEITLHNHKDAAAHILVRELLYRGLNWDLTAASDKWQKQDYRTIHIPVDVPANGEKKITYTVKYSW